MSRVRADFCGYLTRGPVLFPTLYVGYRIPLDEVVFLNIFFKNCVNTNLTALCVQGCACVWILFSAFTYWVTEVSNTTRDEFLATIPGYFLCVTSSDRVSDKIPPKIPGPINRRPDPRPSL